MTVLEEPLFDEPPLDRSPLTGASRNGSACRFVEQMRCVDDDRYEVDLQSGRLALRVTQADWRLDELCQYASRRNRNRGFLFISKVLGKHWPVLPSTMRRVYQHLAGKVLDAKDTVYLGLAETATGLAAGVFDEKLRSSHVAHNLLTYTTRYELQAELAFEAREAHSHAPCHRVYMPLGARDRELFLSAQRLVIIDDEISTGATIADVALRYHKLNSSLEEVLVLSLTDWLSDERRLGIQREVGIPLNFASLLRGELDFFPNAHFFSETPPAISNAECITFETNQFLPGGRTGLSSSAVLPPTVERMLDTVATGERVLVLGTGEFLHLPFLFAEAFEQRGVAVWFQSTTRSPIMLGPAIQSSLSFADACLPHLPNFIYNVLPGDYDRVFVCYESKAVCAPHDVVQQLSATPVHFGDH
jgi:hypothetical protein